MPRAAASTSVSTRANRPFFVVRHKMSPNRTASTPKAMRDAAPEAENAEGAEGGEAPDIPQSARERVREMTAEITQGK